MYGIGIMGVFACLVVFVGKPWWEYRIAIDLYNSQRGILHSKGRHQDLAGIVNTMIPSFFELLDAYGFFLRFFARFFSYPFW